MLSELFGEFRYPSAPLGAYESGFPDEYAFEDWLYRLECLAEDEQALTAGEHVSDPAADAYRYRIAAANREFAGRVLTSDRQARDLVGNRLLQISRPRCPNLVRTDRDIEHVKQQAAQLAEVVADPLAPPIRHARERHELARLTKIIDGHKEGAGDR